MAQSTGTPGLDRRATLDQARRLAESGQIIPAIEAYELLALDDPSDWALRNTIGDLLVRARHTEKAVQQFLKAAQLQADAGFMAHASGLLKKALRVAPGHSEAKKRLDALNGARFKRPEHGRTPRVKTASAPAIATAPAAPAASAPSPAATAPSPAAARRASAAAEIPIPVPPASSVPAIPRPAAPVAAVAVEAAKPVPVEPLAAPSPSTTVLSASAFSSMAVLDVRPALVAVSRFAVEPTSQTEVIDPSAHADLDLSGWLDGGVWGGKPGDAPA
jgi:hypothetical protein